MQAYEEHVQELDRLRWIHEASQLQLVTALAWQAKQEAMLASAKASIEQSSALQVSTHSHILSLYIAEHHRLLVRQSSGFCDVCSTAAVWYVAWQSVQGL